MSELTIEAAGPESAGRVLALMRRYYEDIGRKLTSEHEEVVVKVLAEPLFGRALLASHDSVDIGYGSAFFFLSSVVGGRAAIIDGVYVVPEARRSGTGHELVTGLLAYCGRDGIKRCSVRLALTDRPAVNLYGSLGFRGLNYTVLSLDLLPNAGA